MLPWTMPSPVFQLLTTYLPWGAQAVQVNPPIQRLLQDLAGWDFDPNETASTADRPKAVIGGTVVAFPGDRITLLQAVLVRLPAQLRADSPESALAQQLIQILLDRGADPTALDHWGRPVEALAPLALRPFLVRARGGDVQQEKDRQQLLALSREMLQPSPVKRLRETWDEQDAPKLFGHPAPLAMLLGAHLWCGTAVEGSASGSAAIAQSRVVHLRSLAKWAAAALPDSDAPAVQALAWAVMQQQADHHKNLAERAAQEHWQKAATAAWEGMVQAWGVEAVGHALKSAWDGRWAGLSGDAALTVAHALGSAPTPPNAVAWALEALDRAAAQAVVVRSISKNGGDTSVQQAWRLAVGALVELSAVHRPGDAPRLWLAHWPSSIGAPLWSQVVRSGVMEKHGWEALMETWCLEQPGRSAQIEQALAAYADPKGVSLAPPGMERARQRLRALSANQTLNQALPGAGVRRAGPRL